MTNYITREAVEILLKDYNDLEIDTRLDIDRVIESNLLNPKQLQIMFCLYSLKLNGIQTAELLGLSPEVFLEEYEELLESFEAAFNGYTTKRERKCVKQTSAQTLSQLLYLFSLGGINPYVELNDKVRKSLLLMFANNYKSELAKETLHQKVHGKPVFNEEVDYNFYKVDEKHELGFHLATTGTDAFIKQYYQNNVKREGAFNFIPSQDYYGCKKVAFKTEDTTVNGKVNLH